MELWFSEEQTPSMRISLRVSEVVHRERSHHQEILVVDTHELGRLLALDDVIQTDEHTEFVYHEMMAHVPLFAHPHPERVLVVGGGDGGVVREALKHRPVAEVVLAEIDGRVVEVSKRHLPSLSTGLEDERCRLVVGDGVAHVASRRAAYDVIIIDSTDPVGPAEGLFSESFYRSVHRALRQGGLMVQQTESPFYNRDLLARVQRDLAGVFARSGFYWAAVPEYPGGMWTMSYGSRDPDPARVPAGRYDERAFDGFATRYYDAEVHRAAFVLPPFARELLAGGAAAGGAAAAENGEG